MKTIGTTQKNYIEGESWNMPPIAKIELFKTPFPAASFGINKVIYSDVSLGLFAGSPIDASFDPLNDEDVILAENGQLWEFLGTSRPFGLPSNQFHLIRWEGYFIVPSNVTGGVDFTLLCNPNGEFYASANSSSYPSALTSGDRRITTTGGTNTDIREADVWSSGWAADSVHTIRVDWDLYAGAYAKCVLLWRPTGETDWRLVDSSVVNTTTAFMTVDTSSDPDSDALLLPGLTNISVAHDAEQTSSVTFQVPLNHSSGCYTYDTDKGCYGVLRPNSRIKVYSGYNTNGAGNTPAAADWIQDGEYFIDRVVLDRTDGNDILSVTARDTRKKAADTINLLFPNILSWDLAGYSSDGVFLNPDGVSRVVGYDSWTLAKTIRDLLSQSGFSSLQLWGKDSRGNYKIQDKSIRLDRGAEYRLKLPKQTSTDQLKFSYEPGRRLLDIIREIVDKFGYEFGVDYEGDVYLREANNPNVYSSSDLTLTGSWSRVEDIYSLKGEYHNIPSGSGNISYTPSEDFEAFNLVIPRGADAGYISISVDGSPLAGWQNYDVAYPTGWFFRDGDDPDLGYNPTVFEVRGLDYDTHTISVDTSGDVSINAIEIFETDRETADITFTTARALREGVESTDANIRNDITVAGADLGIDIDTFIVSRSVDVGSIHTPARKNYIGARRPVLAPDKSLTRQDVASYQSLAALKRYSTLADIVNLDIPAYPHLELGDCINITDAVSGTTGTDFWINRLSWTMTTNPRQFLMSAALNPYKPYPSYKPLDDADNPTAIVSDFQFSRTDGATLDPAFFTDNGLDPYVGPDSHYGCYIGRFSEENPPVFIEIGFKLWKTSICTVVIKDAITFKVMAVLAQEEVLEWGEHTFLWDGKWYTADGRDYRYAPVDPDFSTDDLKAYLDRRDPFKTSGDLGDVSPEDPSEWEGAGYFLVEMTYKPLNDLASTSVTRAVNSSDTSIKYGKLILPKTYSAGNAPTILLNHTEYVETEPESGLGGRWEIYTTEYAANGVSGIRYQLNHNDQDTKFKIKGHLDCFLLLTNGASLASGETDLLVYRQTFDEESFAAGPHLYLVTDDGGSPWTTQLVAGETDFLDPADGPYQLLIDPIGMPLKGESTKRFRFLYDSSIQRNTIKDWELGTFNDQVIPFTNDYLDFFANLYPDKYVNAAYYLEVEMDAIPRSGIPQKIRTLYSYKLESSSYTSNKHCVFPYGSPTYDTVKGQYCLTNRPTPSSKRIVHFTCDDTPNYSYD